MTPTAVQKLVSFKDVASLQMAFRKLDRAAPEEQCQALQEVFDLVQGMIGKAVVELVDEMNGRSVPFPTPTPTIPVAQKTHPDQGSIHTVK